MNLSSNYYKQFTTHDSATGALLDATGTPTAVLQKNGVANDMALTVSKVSTGLYKIVSTNTFVVDADWADGDRGECIVTATVDGVETSAVIDSFELSAIDNTAFEARTLPSADYTVVGDLGTVQTGDSYAIVAGDHGLVSIQDDVDAILADTGELQGLIDVNNRLPAQVGGTEDIDFSATQKVSLGEVEVTATVTEGIQEEQLRLITQGASDILVGVALKNADTGLLLEGVTLANLDYQIVSSKRGAAAGYNNTGNVGTTFSGALGVYDGASDGVAMKAVAGGFYVLGIPDSYFSSASAYDFISIMLTDPEAATICPLILKFQVLPFSLDTITQPVNVTQWNSVSLGDAPADVNILSISGDETAADTLELFVEALGSDQKPLLSDDQTTLSVTLEDGSIAQSTLAADIGTTAYASNRIALAVNLALENINLQYLLKNTSVLNTHVADQSVLAYLMAIGGDVSDYNPTTDSLENLFDTVTKVADTNTKVTEIQTVLGELTEVYGETYRFTTEALMLSPNSISVGELAIQIRLRTDEGVYISNATVWLNTTNDRTASIVTPQVTNAVGSVYFDLSAATYYVFAKHNDWSFSETGNSIVVDTSGDTFILEIATAIEAPEIDTTAYSDSFITRSIANFRNAVDEPELNAKYSDADIITMLSNAYVQVLGEMNRNATTPVIVKYQVAVTSGVTAYMLPVNRSSIYAIYGGSDAEGYKIFYSDGGRLNKLGRDIWVEGNTLNVLAGLFEDTTITVEYTPLGNAKFAEGTVTAVSSSGTEVTVYGTPNQGTLSRNCCDYIGATFRILTDSEDAYDLVQERVITNYNPVTQILTLNVALTPNQGDGVHTGTTYYEIVPAICRNLDNVLAIYAAWGIANREGMKKRADGLMMEFKGLIRNLRLNSFYSDLNKAVKMNSSSYDNNYGRKRFRDGRRI